MVGPIIKASAVWHQYQTRNGFELVIDGLDLEIFKGEFLAVLGPSGVGKSTLIKICSGLLRPTKGDVLFYGNVHSLAENLSGNSSVPIPVADAVKQHTIGTLFQRPVLASWRTVLGNALLPLEVVAPHDPHKIQKVKELLFSVGFAEEDFTKFPHQLSGGMQQRLALVMLLSYSPEVLFLDEPFGALDAITRRQMHKLVLYLWERSRIKTVVFVTHDVHEAVFLADRVLVLPQKPVSVVEYLPVPISRPRSFDFIYDGQFKKIAEQAFAIMNHRGAKTC